MNRIREIRKAKNLSGPEVAQKLNITPQYLYGFEKGTRTLSAEMASKLAELFNVTVDYLLGRTDEDEIGQEISSNRSAPEWANAKDKRDLEKFLTDPRGLYYKGVEFSENDKAKMLGVLETIFWDAKRRNKEAYKKSREKDKPENSSDN